MSVPGNIHIVDEIKFAAYGIRFSVGVTDKAAIEKIKGVLPFYSTFLDTEADVEHIFSLIWSETGEDSLYQNGELVATRVDNERLVALLDTCIRMALGEGAPKHIFIHAGVVGWKGQALIFPANSYSGKTTLVAELIKNGAIYFSDEYAVIDENGLVHPYPKPLSMRKPGGYEQTETDIKVFGGVQANQPFPAGMVFLTSYESGAEWSPNVLSEGQGVLELIPHCLGLRTNPEFVLKVLNLISKRAIIASSKRGEVDVFAKLLLNFPDSHIFT